MRQCMDADNLHRRLKKIIGQVQAIDRMVDEDVPCEDMLSQINAAKSALHKVGQIVLEGHIQHCVRDGIEHGDVDKTIENFTKAVELFANMVYLFPPLVPHKGGRTRAPVSITAGPRPRAGRMPHPVYLSRHAPPGTFQKGVSHFLIFSHSAFCISPSVFIKTVFSVFKQAFCFILSGRTAAPRTRDRTPRPC